MASEKQKPLIYNIVVKKEESSPLLKLTDTSVELLLVRQHEPIISYIFNVIVIVDCSTCHDDCHTKTYYKIKLIYYPWHLRHNLF